MRNRKHSINLYDGNYELVPNNKMCFYCGGRQSCLDHFPPITRFDECRTKYGFTSGLKIPSCSECNGLLSDSLQSNLQTRINTVKEKLKNRHKNILDLPDWSETELSGLGSNMQHYVRRNMQKKHQIESRINYQPDFTETTN